VPFSGDRPGVARRIGRSIQLILWRSMPLSCLLPLLLCSGLGHHAFATRSLLISFSVPEFTFPNALRRPELIDIVSWCGTWATEPTLTYLYVYSDNQGKNNRRDAVLNGATTFQSKSYELCHYIFAHSHFYYFHSTQSARKILYCPPAFHRRL
jgi:hypothetical protein